VLFLRLYETLTLSSSTEGKEGALPAKDTTDGATAFPTVRESISQMGWIGVCSSAIADKEKQLELHYPVTNKKSEKESLDIQPR
jgi:hypothetical protein